MVEHNHLPLLFSTDDLYHTSGIDTDTQQILSIHTYYENMWIDRGLNIKYLKFRLPAEGTLNEPDVEIPLDEYRSYHRDKRSPVVARKWIVGFRFEFWSVAKRAFGKDLNDDECH